MTAYENHSSKVTHTHPQVQLRQGQDVTINLTVSFPDNHTGVNK